MADVPYLIGLVNRRRMPLKDADLAGQGLESTAHASFHRVPSLQDRKVLEAVLESFLMWLDLCIVLYPFT